MSAQPDPLTWSASLPILISVISLVIAFISAAVAYIAPQSASRLAETLRTQNQDRETRTTLKRYVFFTLMQERAAAYTIEATRAFNVIDVVFHDNILLREAWAQYHKSLDKNANVPESLTKQYFSHLLKLLAEDIGMKDIRTSDLDRIYQPTFVQRKLYIETMQATIQERELERALAQMQKNVSSSPT